MLAQIWAGSKTSTVDDFNPYQITKRKATGPGRGRGARLSEIAPLLQQWVPAEGREQRAGSREQGAGSSG